MSLSEELERLAKLNQTGVLNDAEFALAKERLLESAASAHAAAPSSWRWVDGRPLLTVGSIVMLLSLFLPWVDVLLFQLNAFDLVRLVFGASHSVSELGSTFGFDTGGVTNAAGGAFVFFLLIATTVSAPLWRHATIRNRQTLVGTVLFVVAYFISWVQYSIGNFLSYGATLFLAATLFNAFVAGALLKMGSLPNARLWQLRDSAAATDEASDRASVADLPASQVDTEDLCEPSAASLVTRVATKVEKNAFVFVGIALLAGAAIVLAITETVPNVIGREQSVATSVIESPGFQPRIRSRVDGNAQEGRVLDQTPSAGTRVLRGRPVAVFVARLPDLRGTVTLNSTSLGPADNCRGGRGYEDIREGLLITVWDDASRVMATGRLSSGTRSPTGDTCTFSFRIQDITQSTSYTLQTEGRRGPTFSYDEVVSREWRLELSLG